MQKQMPAGGTGAPSDDSWTLDGRLESLLSEAEALLQQTAEAAVPILAESGFGAGSALAAVAAARAAKAPRAAARGGGEDSAGMAQQQQLQQQPVAQLHQLWGGRDLGACLEDICGELDAAVLHGSEFGTVGLHAMGFMDPCMFAKAT